MKNVLITFRSVTYAQRAEQILRSVGISAGLRRTPGELSNRGCGYGLWIEQGDTTAAAGLLRERAVAFGKVYVRSAEGKMEEWTV